MAIDLTTMQLAQDLKQTVNIERSDGNYDSDNIAVTSLEMIILPNISQGTIDPTGVVRTDYDFDGLFITPNPLVRQGDIVVQSDNNRLAISSLFPPVEGIQRLELIREK